MRCGMFYHNFDPSNTIHRLVYDVGLEFPKTKGRKKMESGKRAYKTKLTLFLPTATSAQPK